MVGRRWRTAAHYVIAVLAASVSVATRQFLTPELGLELPYITLFPAIMLSGWLGGFGPGLLCTILSVLAAAYLWLPSTLGFGDWPTIGDALGMALFCATGLFTSTLAEARLRALARAQWQVEEIRQAREHEREARDEAEYANRAKDEFLAILAHELRQPLAAIVAALGVIRHQFGSESAVAERSIAVVQRQTTHLQRLVEDLLDASRVVRGEVVLRRHPVDVVDIVRDAIDAARPRIDERRQHLELRLPERPVVVDGDPTRLQQIVSNVLSNASRYTPNDGRIQVLVDGNSTEMTVRVVDSGEGISPADLPRIFSLFTRAGDRRGTGLGIGLAVARSLVQLHGGTIEALSEGPGQGSEFRITLPLAARRSATSA